MKDIPFLLRAMSMAGEAVDRLLIVGEGPQRDDLMGLAKQSGIADRILWTGRLDDPTAAYRAMDVMVLPSIYEPFGNVVLEAMAAGTPVIGRRRSADPSQPVLVANEELIRHGCSGWLVDPHDPMDLVRRLKRLKNEPSRLRQAGQYAHAIADEMTWQRTIEAYMRLMNIRTSRSIERQPHALAA